eukprot:3782058-Alexandrium_andersonii.AAC.1
MQLHLAALPPVTPQKRARANAPRLNSSSGASWSKAKSARSSANLVAQLQAGPQNLQGLFARIGELEEALASANARS